MIAKTYIWNNIPQRYEAHYITIVSNSLQEAIKSLRDLIDKTFFDSYYKFEISENGLMTYSCKSDQITYKHEITPVIISPEDIKEPIVIIDSYQE